jgi:hypothetical protein
MCIYACIHHAWKEHSELVCIVVPVDLCTSKVPLAELYLVQSVHLLYQGSIRGTLLDTKLEELYLVQSVHLLYQGSTRGTLLGTQFTLSLSLGRLEELNCACN